MTEPVSAGLPPIALLRVLTWLSPSFPVGAFAYSGGFERAVHDRLVSNAASLRAWIGTLVLHGPLRNDAVLLAEAYRAAGDPLRLDAVADLASALSGSRERHMETLLLGEAFVAAASAWPQPVLAQLAHGRTPYPVAVGAVAGGLETGLEPVLLAFVHAGVSQLVSAAIRLGVTGQRDGMSILAGLEETIAAAAGEASLSTLDDLGSAAIQADLMSMRHEVQPGRLFRS